MLLIEREPGILVLTLNRPDKRNSLHPELLDILNTEFIQVANDASINVVVLTGVGSSFCAGLDLQHLLNLSDAGKVEYMRQLFDLFERMYTLPQPIIAAINGPAMAGGFDLAAFCDLRLCVTTAKFAQTEILLGITQIMFPLYHSIGLTRAKELAFTGEAISAEEAHRIGFVNHVYAAESLMSEALKLADKLAARPCQTLFATKRLSRELLDADTPTAFGKMFGAISERLQAEEHKQKVVEYVENLKKR
ncbi:MAG: enoyl-CoA hydratase/isomerase family protein [Acidobacteria bacterium]|nr:enoyl-CoA hydratase/isomerase family protein [Acidobacteriota bacterium]